MALFPLCVSFGVNAQDYDYNPSRTAILLVDPYNDFLSEGGLLYAMSKETLDANNAIENMKNLVTAARAAGLKIIYVPHHQSREGDKTGWKFGRGTSGVFKAGTWAAEYHPDLQMQPGDIEARQHWQSSGFANTDLDFLLKQHGLDHVVLAGMRANTCIESTARYAVELGYHTTMLTDAVGAFNMREMEAAVEIDYPVISHNVLSTGEFIDLLN
ncbi:MAG: isochorismatase [Gammaproteobacteria bacterium]|nr:isochorismatase [Gammaproteobacteria bacterium]MBM89490.1 isochorismatase [Gammaproteobacteria bacterium]